MVRNKGKKLPVKAKEKKPVQRETPTLWNPWEVFDTMDRWFFDDPWRPWWQRRPGQPMLRSPWLDIWPETDMKQTAVDIVDTGKAFKIVAEMPGVSKHDVDIEVTPTSIRICGECKSETEAEEEGYLRRERSYSSLCRTMPFPEEVDPHKAEANLKDGILEITVTKKTPTSGKGTKVPVK